MEYNKLERRNGCRRLSRVQPATQKQDKIIKNLLKVNIGNSNFSAILTDFVIFKAFLRQKTGECELVTYLV